MKAARRILLYGNSVILGTIGMSLKRHSQFEVTRLATPLREAQMPEVAETEIILFDLATTHPEAVLPLLEINPSLQLVGISPDVNLIRVWSSRELRELSTQGLIELIKSEGKITKKEDHKP